MLDLVVSVATLMNFPRRVHCLPILGALVVFGALSLCAGCAGVTAASGKQLSPSQLAFSVNSLPSGAVGAPYSAPVPVAGGAAPYSFTVASGALPAGMNLAPTGTISGTPTAVGELTFNIQVKDSSSPAKTASQAFRLNIVRGPKLSITTDSLPDGVIDKAYSVFMTASGGEMPYSWSIASGTLPLGLNFSSSGRLAGTPGESGSFTFSMKVADSSSPMQTVTKSFTVKVSNSVPPVSISTSSLPNGTTGTAYVTTLAATGGMAPYSWHVSFGTLPAGLSFSTSGKLSGTPTTAGSSRFTLEVADSSSPKLTATKTFTVTVSPAVPPVSITTPSLPNGTTGNAYSATLVASGGIDPYSWRVSFGILPAGLSFSSSGKLSGTPTTAGSSRFTLEVADSSSPKLTATKTFTVTVSAAVPPVSITTPSLPNGTTGNAYSTTVAASGGVTPYSWTVSSGTLPAGLTLSSNGKLSGTPTATGSSTFTLQVTDSSSPKLTATKTFTVTVSATVPPVSITTPSLPNGTTGSAYSASAAASGGTAPYSWTVSSGTLPAGLSLSSDGKLSGTPTTTGSSTFTLQVADSSSPKQTASQSYTVNVSGAILSITTSTLSNGTTGVRYSASVLRSGGTPSFTWSISAGQLPAGLSLAATTGAISGTPTQTGNYNFTVKVVDSSSPQQSATKAFSVAVTNSTLDQYGGLTTMPSPNQATPFFRVEKFGNKWMFVDPANNGFFMIGMYVLDEDQSVDDMGNSYYNRTNAKYGDTGPTWGPAQLQRIQAWGFNSVGTYATNYVLPVTTDYRWPGDQSNPVKVPFVGLLRPAYYGMLNENNWAPQPIKNMLYSVSPFYNGYNPGNGVADYYDNNLTTFFTNELKNDSYSQAIKSSPYKQYMIGMNADDGDEMYGFGKGPDFSGGFNNSHLGWMVLTMSPMQTANPNKGFVYSDTVIYSKQALHDQLLAKYGTIAALNSAWGSNYTTFGSSGNTVTAEAIGSGNGSSLTFTKTLAAATVSKYSLQILLGGQPVGGDTGGGRIWGPHLSGTIDYTTGALNITFGGSHAPASGAAITANYVQNGWGMGSGLLDEDGRASHRSWVGIDYTFMTDVNPTAKADLDDYLYQIAAHYFSMCKSGIQAWMPGMMYFGPDTLGTWGGPSNRNVLKAASQYIDVMAMGGGTPLTQAMLDFMFTHYGDRPFYFGEFRTANPDSAFFRYHASVPQTDFTTQGGRGQDYSRTVTTYPNLAYTATGSRPYVGILWWQYLDNWGEKDDWGIVTLSDNAYDGNESVKGPGGVGVRSVPCSAPLGSYLCGGEERNYGDIITPITAAHQQIQQAVQH